jgi:2-amino-4-hydroxy-6-hydroxymethyldihydropteridine diphosphokinase
MLLGECVHVDARSSVYETEPVGFADQPPFWNMAVRVTTVLPPEALLNELIAIEKTMGRERTFRNAPRIIDLDILLFGDVVYETDQLTIPHPRMNKRAFVLMPLTELDAALRDPRSGERFADVLAGGIFEKVEVVGSL